jgi:excisionase family DNA binding protein
MPTLPIATVKDNPKQAIMPGTAPKLVRVSYLTERLDIPTSTTYAMAKDGRLPGVVWVGKTLRFDVTNLEAWIASGGGSI